MMAKLKLMCFLQIWLIYLYGVPATEVASANADFGLKFYSQIAEQEDAENIFFSPYSISTAFAMVYMGSRGNTATELASTFSFSDFSSKDTLKIGYKELIKTLFESNTDDYTLKSANKFFGQDGYGFEAEFKSDLQDFFKAGTEMVDFKQNVEGARQIINQWVEEQTEDTIKDLFGPGSLNSDNILVLVNALYFKADWLFKFKPDDTKDTDFKLIGGSTVSVPMMHLDKSLKYMKNAVQKFSMVELPYKGEELAMFIILPDQTSDLASVEHFLKADILESQISRMLSEDIKLDLPKFKVTQKMELPDLLEALGLRDVFTSSADLSGINGDGGILISKAIHQAYISIDEEGTEASAATGIGIMLTSVRIPTTFVVDHPFILFIREKSTGSILFMGRVVNPETATKPLQLRMMRSVGSNPDEGTGGEPSIFGIVSMVSVVMAMVAVWLFK